MGWAYFDYVAVVRKDRSFPIGYLTIVHIDERKGYVQGFEEGTVCKY